ncbi:MAG TPA: tRNA lysidine(34) synthetase TilS [Vicinamibacterales bacterium]
MLTLQDRVRRTIREHRLLADGDRVLVAVSGGADSTALALLLPGIAPTFGATVVGLAHLNHQLRDAAGDDERFCRELAEHLGLPIVVERRDVSAEARLRRTSIEDAARAVRYAFLREAAARLRASRIAVAHTRNDQAETVLLRLFRGAGPVGLAGIYPAAGEIVRPLLDVSRREVEAFLREAGVAWREDATNADVSIPRNRVRHELLPWLARHFGEGVVDVLHRQAALSREDAELLEKLAAEEARDLVLEKDEVVEVHIPGLLELPGALRRRCVLRALRQAAGGRFVGFAHVDAVLALTGDAGESPAAAVDLPGQRVERRGDRLIFTPATPDPGRAGRKRGRPVSKKVEAAATPPGADEGAAGRKIGPGGATLKSHAPKGGRG